MAVKDKQTNGIVIPGNDLSELVYNSMYNLNNVWCFSSQCLFDMIK